MASIWNRLRGRDGSTSHVLTANDVQKIKNLADRAGERWSETFSIVLKWVFATLITLATGGVYLSLTLGVHPDAALSAMNLFFGAMFFTLASSASVIVPLAAKLAFTDEILAHPQPEGHEVEGFRFRRLFERSSGPLLSLVLVFGAFTMIGFGGKALSEGISRCSTAELEQGIRNGEPVVLGSRGSKKHCYFYEIEGLSNDPLQRAQQVIELLDEKDRQNAKPD